MDTVKVVASTVGVGVILKLLDIWDKARATSPAVATWQEQILTDNTHLRERVHALELELDTYRKEAPHE